jgi:hypothetical protein
MKRPDTPTPTTHRGSEALRGEPFWTRCLSAWVCREQRALVYAAVMTALSSGLAAHHSATMFEETKTITVEGVVKEFQYTNPHSWLLIDVKDNAGKVTTWGFEAEGPSTLQRAGIRPSEFPIGTRVTMTGRPMKDGRPAAIWVLAVRADGKKFDPREGFRVR